MKRLEIRDPVQEEPRVLMLYSLQKLGKTEATLQLPDAITLDFDDSASYFRGRYHTFKGMSLEEKYKDYVKKIKNLEEDVKENGKYDFIIIDTITEFYSEFANTIGILTYNKQEGKNLPISYDVTNLAYGLGYALKRNAVIKLVNTCKKFANHIIILGHIADKSVNKETGQFDVADIDLEGKLKNILALKVDAIGYMFRDKDNENYISFKHSNSIPVGIRSKDLSGKTILISKLINDKLETYWNNIYKHLNKK